MTLLGRLRDRLHRRHRGESALFQPHAIAADEQLHHGERCCVGTREAWRARARDRGLLPNSSNPKSVSQRAANRSGTVHISREELAQLRPTSRATFARFLDLPLELRETIYEMYLDEYSKPRLTSFKLPSLSGPLEERWFYKPIPPRISPFKQIGDEKV